jgi:hypothetical protein
MKKMRFQRWRLMLCGDRYGFGLWLNDENVNRSCLKNVPHETAWAAYQTWLAGQPTCGHKQCAKRHTGTRQPWRGNESAAMWVAYHHSLWIPA